MNEIAMAARREKARNLRYKKPALRDLSLDSIQSGLWEMQEECENVRWSTDGEGYDYLCDVLGGEDEAQQFKLEFSDLEASVERMMDDMQEAWIPEHFDILLVAAGLNEVGGGMMGYDEFEDDYYGLNAFEAELGFEEAQEQTVKKHTKKQLVDCLGRCFRITVQYLALRVRYDSLKAVMDIVSADQKAELDTVRDMDRLYDEISREGFGKYSVYEKERRFDKMIADLPPMAWLQ